MNNQAVNTPLLTLLCLLITVVAGFLLKKQRYELLDLYAQRLTDERLKRYPEFYSLLSSAVKVLDYPDVFQGGLDLAFLQTQINQWDSSWGVLLAKASGERAQTLRRVIHDLAQKPAPLTTADTENLRETLVKMELALRVDLGVYALEKVNIQPGFHPYQSKRLTRPDK